MSHSQIQQVEELAKTFIRHYEQVYVRHDINRINRCRYTVHLLLHLASSIRECGTLMSSSQYWIEKYIGWVIERTNARNNPVQSMLKTAVFTESYKLVSTIEVDKAWKKKESQDTYSFRKPLSLNKVRLCFVFVTPTFRAWMCRRRTSVHVQNLNVHQ